MNIYRTQQRLGVETSKKSINTDTYLNISLDGKERLLPSGEINHIVDIGERFDVERQKSKYYRILGTINSTISNCLFNLNNPSNTDLYTFSGFNNKIFLGLNTIDITYAQSLNNHLIERNGWFGYVDPRVSNTGLCSFIDMEPKKQRFDFIPDIKPYNSSTPINNWSLTITYPSSSDKTHNIINNGLLIVEATPAVVATREMVAFAVPCLHNLVVGNTVKISGTQGFDGEHVVIRTGLDNGDLKDYYFVIDLPYSSGIVTSNSRMKKMLAGVESEYYFRKFRKIKTRSSQIIESDDYEIYKLAFSENVYNDNITQFVFNEDIDITDLVDNLNRPVSELYLTIVKTDSNGIFSSVSSGIETPFIPSLTSVTNTYLLNVPAINRIHNGSTLPFPTHNALEIGITIDNGDFYGDLVEYNKNEVKETTLANICHRFNTINRETEPTLDYYSSTNGTKTQTTLGPRQEGYYYKAHHLIRIREYSNYVEIGDEFTVGIPDYAVDLGDGRYLWRDILDIGFNETSESPINYPFLNGCHYLYNNFCFNVKRQDPFGYWGLLWDKFPSDPLGNTMTDKYTVKSQEDVC